MMKRGHDVESAPGIWRRRTAMEHYAGIDVSLERSSVCVVDALGKIVKEAKISSEPAALVAFFEAGPGASRSTEKSWPHFWPSAVDFCGSRSAIGAATERARALAMPRPMPRIARQCTRGVETTALL